MDVNGTPVSKFITQLRDDAARIRGNIAARPNLDQTDPATFSDMAYTQAMFNMSADIIENLETEGFKLAAGVCEHRSGDDHGNPYCLKSKTNI